MKRKDILIIAMLTEQTMQPCSIRDRQVSVLL